MFIKARLKSLLAVAVLCATGIAVAAEDKASWKPLDDLSVNVKVAEHNKDLVKFLEREDAPEEVQFGAGYKVKTEAVGSFTLFGELSYKVRTLESNQAPVNNPLDNETKATLGFGWEKGSFSGVLKGSVLTPKDELAQMDMVDAVYDVEFSWKTPWLGDLSVGAKNVMDTAVKTSTLNNNDPDKKGRVPYIKYKLDL
ncbi:MAG: hypothetical protein ACWA5R_00060 [bacterium]